LDRHAARVLDYLRILEVLAGEARTPQGGDLLRTLSTASAPAEARERLAESEAFSSLVETLGWPPVEGMERVDAHLDRAAVAGACLDAEALLAVRDAVVVSARVVEYLEDAGKESSPLGAWAEGQTPLYGLEESFARTFGPRGEILDSASPALARIRAEIKELRGKVLKILQRVLRDTEYEHVVQDDFITQRSNRYVIPLRTDFRGYLNGIVHDHSNSGQTVFVEPMEVVETNNRVNEVMEEEYAEIRRILTALTAAVGAAGPSLRAQIALVARVDALSSKVRFARKLRCVSPEIADEPVLEVKGARHPFLELREGAKVVPIRLYLPEGTNLLLITGANAGGKTVALKTAGLLVLMAHSGLFIPAEEGAKVGWFPEVLADIGDEQDLDKDLSTFSAHMARLKDIFDLSGEGSLVLLDELGTGTDPTQGAALSVAVLEELRRTGARVMATTHLDGLKAYAYGCKDALNAAVAFDPKTGTPLYNLLYGQAGSSNALDVAERMGLPQRVLDRARSISGDSGEGTAKLLREIEEARDEARLERERNAELNRSLERELRSQKELTEEARKERRSAMADARGEAMALIRKMREDLNRVVRELAEEKIKQKDAQSALEEASEKAERRFPKPKPEEAGVKPPKEIIEGAKVFVKSLGKNGIIEGKVSGGKVRVAVGPMKLFVPVEDLGAPSGEKKQAKVSLPSAGVKVTAEKGDPDVVLIGMTVEDALEAFDKALNKALVSGIDRFRVVHGHGTGALRKAIREKIAATPRVRRAENEENNEAVTWIEIL
jgi:DNA mismatch repair protein MutS2